MPARARDYEHAHGKKLLFLGALIFVIGLMLNMGFDWSMVLMVVGVLVFLKGLFVKFMKK